MTLEENLNEAFRLTEDNQHEMAIELFKKIIREDPLNLKAYEGIIQIYFLRKDSENIIKWFYLAKNNNCISDYIHYCVGLAFSSATQLDDAEKHLMIAANSTQLSDKLRSDSLFFLAITQSMIAKKYKFEESKASLFEEKTKGAIDSLTKALKLTDSTDSEWLFEIYSELGKCFKRLNDFKQALDYFDKAIKLKPKDSKVHFQLGLCLKKLGGYREALDSFSEAIRLQNHLMSFQEKSSLLAAEKFYEEAILCLEELIKVISTQQSNALLVQHKIVAYQCLGKIWLELHENAKAISCFSMAIDLDENNPVNYYYKGAALFRINQVRQALKNLITAVNLLRRNSNEFNFDTQVMIYHAYVKILNESDTDKQNIKHYILSTVEQVNYLAENHCASSLKISDTTAKKIEELRRYAKKFIDPAQKDEKLEAISKKFNYQETDLHRAARRGDLAFLNSLPPETDINILNENHESPLMLAVEAKQLAFAEGLVQRGALINLATVRVDKNGLRRYKTVLEISTELALEDAKNADRWKLVELLLRNREIFSIKHLEPFNASASNPSGADEMYVAICKLFREDIEKFMTQRNINKYLAHLMDREGIVKELDPLQRRSGAQTFELGKFNVTIFLMLRLNSYLNIYINKILSLLKLEASKPNSETQKARKASKIYSRTRFIFAIVDEIVIGLETLRCIRDGLLVKNICNRQQIPADIKLKIKSAYLENIKNKILNLRGNQVYVFYTGIDDDHGMYINFSRDSKTKLIHRRIDNLGKASDKHISENGKINPCELPPMTESQLGQYLDKVYRACFTSRYPFCFWQDNYSLIYHGPSSKPAYYTPAHMPQSVMNCVVKSKNIGEEIRMGDFLYRKLLGKERKFAQLMDRMNKSSFEISLPETPLDFSKVATLAPEIINHLPRAKL